MTIEEFASKSKGSAILNIIVDGSLWLTFDTAYWQFITSEVLDMEINSFEINNQLMKKAEVNVFVGVVESADEFEDLVEDDEDYDEGEPEEDPADDLEEEDPADNTGGDLDDGDDGGDGDDE